MPSTAPPKVDSRTSSVSDFYRAVSPDLFRKAHDFQGFIQDFRDRRFDRYELPIMERRGGRVLTGAGAGLPAREVLFFCSADYLDLAHAGSVKAASAAAADQHGTSVASVATIGGNTDLHDVFRQHLASFVNQEDLTLFPTGYAANVGTIAALCNPLDLVLVDKQVHYSILEGVRLAGAQWESFAHSDLDDLKALLGKSRQRKPRSGILVIIEGVYGIDGDVAPVREICRLAHEYGARVMVDDAHATGVIGPSGRGTSQGAGTPDLVMGSLSKSLASIGGWIATERAVAEYLRYFAKSVVFSVGLPAPVIAAAEAALGIIQEDPGVSSRVMTRAAQLQAGLVAIGVGNAARSGSAIVSAVVGSEPVLRDVLRDLFFEGVWAEGLPFPAVPRGEERIRFRVRSAHTEEDVQEAVRTTERVFTKHGVLKRRPSAPTRVATPDLTAAIVDLAIQSARSKSDVLPWVSRPYFEKIVRNEPPWALFRATSDWAAAFSGSELVACAQATTEPPGANRRARGFIGQIFHANGHEGRLPEVLSAAVDSLRGRVTEIVGPASSPLQVLGGGLFDGPPATPKPFLESQSAPLVGSVLRTLGFTDAAVNRYTLHELKQLRSACRQDGPPTPGLTLRPLDRGDMGQDLARILPLFNDAIGQLPYCAALTVEGFCGLASEIRDVMVADLWWVAEIDGRPVGFVGAFPDLSEGFAAAGGNAGVADLEALRVLSDRAARGFIAWLAVDRPHMGVGIGNALVSRVLECMAERNFADAWISWELVDGDGFVGSLRARAGEPLLVRDHRVLSLALD